MRNLLKRLAVKGLLIVAIIAHWLLDDLAFFLPDTIVDYIAKALFTMTILDDADQGAVTGNGKRFDAWLKFWNDEE